VPFGCAGAVPLQPPDPCRRARGLPRSSRGRPSESRSPPCSTVPEWRAVSTSRADEAGTDAAGRSRCSAPMWTRRPVLVESQYFDSGHLRSYPSPSQRPHPPLWRRAQPAIVLAGGPQRVGALGLTRGHRCPGARVIDFSSARRCAAPPRPVWSFLNVSARSSHVRNAAPRPTRRRCARRATLPPGTPHGVHVPSGDGGGPEDGRRGGAGSTTPPAAGSQGSSPRAGGQGTAPPPHAQIMMAGHAGGRAVFRTRRCSGHLSLQTR